ncbi:hypothetical protein [Streptomyces griseoloalbus]|uniref:Uncharacterized protein n=1 Tax=Streptomyces griseoloalbus TaxID=67303 RepID=A0A7W8BRQ0_9ACTN|nr:hypothetical protein [Streptomyces albaduncus]MBB5126449.1 hypothetical protein [Streptomyces albaduncus]
MSTVSPVRLNARPRHGADSSVTSAAAEAVRALLAAGDNGRVA